MTLYIWMKTPEEIGAVILTKEQALWQRHLDNAILSIEQLQEQIRVTEAVRDAFKAKVDAAATNADK